MSGITVSILVICSKQFMLNAHKILSDQTKYQSNNNYLRFNLILWLRLHLFTGMINLALKELWISTKVYITPAFCNSVLDILKILLF